MGAQARLAGTKGADGAKIVPFEVDVAGGKLKIVSMGLLVDDEDTALMWRGLILAKALEQFLVDVRWGDLDYLLIDMPPGTGDIQMALARLLPQAEMLVVTTPAQGAQKVAARVADMARRSYLKVLGVVENMHAFIAPDGSSHAIFGSGGGRRLAVLTGAPLVGEVPIDGAVSEGGDVGQPVVLTHPDLPAARALTEIAAQDRGGAPPAGRDGRLHRAHARAGREARPRCRSPVTNPIRQGLVFGEIADEYDRARPSYPDELFDAVMAYGSLRTGDAALEIGAGTGKATRGFSARGLAVHALEPSPGMARVLRARRASRSRKPNSGVGRRARLRSAWCSRRRRGTGCTTRTVTRRRLAHSHPAARSRCSGTRVVSCRKPSGPTTTPPTTSTRPS